MTTKERVAALRKAAKVLAEMECNDLSARCDDHANRLEEAEKDSGGGPS